LDGLITALGLGPTLDLLALSPPGWGGNLLRGLVNSIQIALGAFGLGLLIGLLGAYGKLYGGPVIRDLLAVYTTIVRAVPELILILILYYAVTDALNQFLVASGYARIQISGVMAGIAVLGVVQGAYATEVLRGAILAVPAGQIEVIGIPVHPRLSQETRDKAAIRAELGECTRCNTDRFFSYRAEGQAAGRMMAIIGLGGETDPPSIVSRPT